MSVLCTQQPMKERLWQEIVKDLCKQREVLAGEKNVTWSSNSSSSIALNKVGCYGTCDRYHARVWTYTHKRTW